MEHKTRCSNAQYLIDYFINLGISESRLLAGVKQKRDFLSNPHNWLPFKDWHQIISNCQEYSPYLTLDDWQRIALSIKDNEATGIWKAIVKFIGINTVYRLSTRYVKSFNTYMDIRINSLTKNSVDFVLVSDSNTCFFTSLRWTVGVLQAVPCVLDLKPATVEILFDQCDLKTIITKLYKIYNFTYKDDNRIIFINDRPYGKRIKLHRKIGSGKDVFTNEYSNEPPYNAIIVTNDLIKNNTILLRKGDLFNAPYGRACLKWHNKQKKVSSDYSKKLKEELLMSFNDQLTLAEQRYFHSEYLREKEQETTLQLKEALKEIKKTKSAMEISWGKRNVDKINFIQEMLFYIKKYIEPNITELSASGLNDKQQILVNKIDRKIKDQLLPLLADKLNRKIKDLMLPISDQVKVKDYNFTFTEYQIVKLIQEGKRSKEICDDLNISLRTVETHRMNIRKKLNISNQKINLSSYLRSIK
jgi:DNA-binding CsgD family transcriptional regulator